MFGRNTHNFPVLRKGKTLDNRDKDIILGRQRFQVVYHGICHESLVFSRYTHEPFILYQASKIHNHIFCSPYCTLRLLIESKHKKLFSIRFMSDTDTHKQASLGKTNHKRFFNSIHSGLFSRYLFFVMKLALYNHVSLLNLQAPCIP